ncbi:MAG TPA: hypothetical protein VM509_06020, partial [Planctomycetota bacterium]|nr:hypothetical protein [Planctomycetota bacterium]
MRVQMLSPDVLPVNGLAKTLLANPRALPGLTIPASVSDIPEPHERFTIEERTELARALEENLSPLAPHVAVLDAVRSLRQAGASVVVAGQQPGFL